MSHKAFTKHTSAAWGATKVQVRRSKVERHDHAHTGKISPEYVAWMGMKKRCYNQNEPGYRRYGAIGITVCEKWRDSFLAFFADLGRRPSESHSLERVNNAGDYEPGNVRWATPKEQARNRKSNLLVKYQGKMIPLAQACEKTGTNYDAAKHRVHRGLPFNKAVRRNARDYRP